MSLSSFVRYDLLTAYITLSKIVHKMACLKYPGVITLRPLIHTAYARDNGRRQIADWSSSVHFTKIYQK